MRGACLVREWLAAAAVCRVRRLSTDDMPAIMHGAYAFAPQPRS